MLNIEKNIIGTGKIHVEKLKHGVMFDATEGMYPSLLTGYTENELISVGRTSSTTYGFVSNGAISLNNNGESWDISKNYFFSFKGEAEIKGEGKAVFFERLGYNGNFNLGGPIENSGRLSYIDGCSDSLLVYPARLGDPCLNLLTFPKNIQQTMHIHPSIRLGIVVEGNGLCHTPEKTIPLTEGSVFCLDEMTQHCFETIDDTMKIVAYHPDSDWGPSDENHPMLNRTYIHK